MEITPVHLQNENDEYVLTGAVVMLRSTIRMGQQLQNLSTQDLSAFSQIIAVSAKMKHVVEQARKLAMLSAPLLITGDTGTGKIFSPMPVTGQALVQRNRIWRSTALQSRKMR